MKTVMYVCRVAEMASFRSEYFGLVFRLGRLHCNWRAGISIKIAGSFPCRHYHGEALFTDDSSLAWGSFAKGDNQ